jgi:hypothetical protein
MPLAEGRSFKILKERLHPDLQVDGKTELVRYMKASTFLLLLGGKVFIPTLSRLQSCDRLEALVPSKVWSLYLHRPGVHPWETVRKFIADSEEWLKSKADRNKPKVVREEGGHFNTDYLDFLSKIWLRELSIRRCVWCWNRFTEESHALWNLYGHRGVAVVSTLDQIDSALETARPLKGLVGSIKYFLPKSLFQRSEIPNKEELATMYSMWTVENLRRPYFYKDSGYKYEDEVRFMIAANARVVAEKGGALIDVDPKKLIKEILVSPQLPEDERRMLKAFGADIRNAESVPLNFPSDEDEEFERSLGADFQPLTIEEGLPTLFDDLDSTSPDIPGAGHLAEPPPEGHVW